MENENNNNNAITLTRTNQIDFASLPEEIHLKILISVVLSYSYDYDLRSHVRAMAFVNRNWYRLINDTQFQQKLFEHCDQIITQKFEDHLMSQSPGNLITETAPCGASGRTWDFTVAIKAKTKLEYALRFDNSSCWFFYYLKNAIKNMSQEEKVSFLKEHLVQAKKLDAHKIVRLLEALQRNEPQ